MQSTGALLPRIHGERLQGPWIFRISSGQKLREAEEDDALALARRAGGRELLGAVDGRHREALPAGREDNGMQATEKNLRGHLSGILCVAISSNGQRIVSGSLDRTVKVWDGATTECLHTLEGHPSAVWAIAISGQGTRIVSGDDYGIVCLWDANEGTCMRTIEVGDNSDGVPVTISADGQTILAAGDGGVKMWDTESGALV